MKDNKAARDLEAKSSRLLDEIREYDSLEKKWDMKSLIEALFPSRRVRNAMMGHYQWEKITEISLRDLMDLAILEKRNARQGYAVSPLLEIRNIGKKGFLAVLDALTYTDLGARCNHEWEHRLARLQRCWRVKGNLKHSWSKPLTPEMDGAMSGNKIFGMGIFAAIYGRRSIRKYKNTSIDQDSIEQLISAAMAAPSAGNQQPWHFIVIDERSILNAIPEYHKYAAMLREAPLAIAVCGDMRLVKHEGYWVQDCSAATQNLLLAAHALGLGACWLGIYPRKDRVEKTQELLGLPDYVIPLAIVSLGHPAEQPSKPEHSWQDRSHHNQWHGRFVWRAEKEKK